ncbi:FMN-binding negative transcriptional regulator [Limibaculum sp. M0105]|uniref:FMN-binding negative transcriptional regulator n=1 Tax=Thermohalobaculum xanthum TaxID=2753746 RepID=A0A8J7M5L6_9RHOB|nr:FMN-binding negative transcriptional regulator [Thermohalobaculum xanthum]MBK0398598.1 FMN-binding negative transcriptional regulator [Thermohalobaculum xanthum]
MHPNPAFRKRSEAEALDFASARGFGIITAKGPDGPLASHVPFLLADGRAEGHFVRSTALARALAKGPLDALLIVSGPDGYISPDWYGEADKVPTWNYLAVHLRGTLRLAPEIDMRGHVDRLSARFEHALLPKTPWTSAKMDQDLMARMMRTIVPWELSVTGVESTFKFNQNRGAKAREGAAAALAAGGTPGMETASLAALMRAADDEH